MKDRKTKIIATIGPATAGYDVMKEILLEGVDVCRLNFSHGTHEDHAAVIKIIRQLDIELEIHTSILADLQGPKLRVGEMKDGHIMLEDGDELVITTEPMKGTKGKVSTTYKQFPKDVRPGEPVMLDDGKIKLEVISSDGSTEVRTKVLHGGKLTANKGINLPRTKVSLPCLTKKDRIDLDFVLTQDIDWVGLSFVRSAGDIIELKQLINEAERKMLVVAKIEKPEAIADIDAIINESDALMVARGDLGVEVPMEQVPLLQKEIIRKCLRQHRPVIVATQMMESMIDNIMPTRAEVNDVANAVLDHADAVMLSAETSVGKFPVQVVQAMNKIIREMETFGGLYEVAPVPLKNNDRQVTDSICMASVGLARRMDVKGIVTMTHSGYTAFKISSMRPDAIIFAFTSNRSILSMLNLVWGVRGHYYDKMVSTDHTIADIKHILRKNKLVQKGDMVVNIASMPIADKGMSNMLKLSAV